MTDAQLPKTLLESVRYFTLERCNEYMKSLKWPDGKIVCPKCGNDSCKELASRPVLKGTDILRTLFSKIFPFFWLCS